MTTRRDLRELLPLHALGMLDPDEAALVDQAVAADPALAGELAAYRDAAPLIATPVAPPASVKQRLMASVGGGRLEPFAERCAKLFDVAVDRAREFLGLIDRPASWDERGAGIGLVHFDGGPACAAADCGFVRIDPGCMFPWHKHLGEETAIILAGTLLDNTGRLLRAGDELVQAEGSEHVLRCESAEPVLFAVRAFNGIEVGGQPYRGPGR
jgi:hypothetical protein